MIEALKNALSQYGVKEIKGEKDNQTILSYAKDIGMDWVQNDETSWCSIFVNWACYKAGLEMTNKANARSWLDVGHRTEEPQVGDIVVFWRVDPKSWKGHVGFYINHDDDFVYCLGGNQSNQVRISAYPIKRLLQYRRLNKV